MAFTFKELKTAKQNIMDRYGLDSGSASRVVGFFSSDPVKVQALIDNDMAPVPVALAALGLSDSAHDCGHDQGEKITQGNAGKDQGTTQAGKDHAPHPTAGKTAASTQQGTGSQGSASASPTKGTAEKISGKNISRTKKTSPKRSGNTEGGKDQGTASRKDQHAASDCLQGGKDQESMHTSAPYMEPLAGDNMHGSAYGDSITPSAPLQESTQATNCTPAVIDDFTSPQNAQTDDIIPLPAVLHDEIVAMIEGYCNTHDISDYRKIHPLEWQAVCMCIGENIKARKLLNDDTPHKGRLYDTRKVVALLHLYGFICAEFKQVAFSHNFPRFAGVSREYLHDYMGQGLTSARVNLAQKAFEVQKASLVGAVTGGGSATVGNIFLSKALAGLQETVTVQHVASAPAPSVSALPVFGDGGTLLPEK